MQVNLEKSHLKSTVKQIVDKNLQPGFACNLEDFVLVLIRVGGGVRVGVEAQKTITDARNLPKICFWPKIFLFDKDWMKIIWVEAQKTIADAGDLPKIFHWQKIG